MSDRASSSRLNAFVDAAFAFAVTLVVVGAGNAPGDGDGLHAAFRDAPAFLAGFVLLAMFWHGHVRWRAMGLGDGGLSVLLSLGLVFCVLMYVQPLRLMSLSMMDLIGLGGPPDMDALNVRDMFALYGLVFFLLAGLIAGLFLQSWRDPSGDALTRAHASGEFGVWAILAGAGGLSLAIATLTPFYFLAPWVYPLLGPAIGLFAWRHQWTPPVPADAPSDTPEQGPTASDSANTR